MADEHSEPGGMKVLRLYADALGDKRLRPRDTVGTLAMVALVIGIPHSRTPNPQTCGHPELALNSRAVPHPHHPNNGVQFIRFRQSAYLSAPYI